MLSSVDPGSTSVDPGSSLGGLVATREKRGCSFRPRAKPGSNTRQAQSLTRHWAQGPATFLVRSADKIIENLKKKGTLEGKVGTLQASTGHFGQGFATIVADVENLRSSMKLGWTAGLESNLAKFLDGLHSKAVANVSAKTATSSDLADLKMCADTAAKFWPGEHTPKAIQAFCAQELAVLNAAAAEGTFATIISQFYNNGTVEHHEATASIAHSIQQLDALQICDDDVLELAECSTAALIAEPNVLISVKYQIVLAVFKASVFYFRLPPTARTMGSGSPSKN